MRILLSTAVIGLVVVLGTQPAAWAQRIGGGGGGGAADGATLDLGGDVSQQTGTDRFLRDSRQSGEFVGSDSSDTREFVGRVESSAGGSSGRRSLGNNSANRGNVNQGRRTQKSTEIRAAITIGFDFHRPAAALLSDNVGSVLSTRLARSGRFQSTEPLDVAIADGTATLRGAVGSNYDRSLVEQLVRLEPGVWRVKNELTVLQTGVPTLVPAAPEPLSGPPKPDPQ